MRRSESCFLYWTALQRLEAAAAVQQVQRLDTVCSFSRPAPLFTQIHTHRQVAECSAEVVRVMLGGAPSKLAGEYSLQLHPKLSASLKATEAAVLPYWCAGVSLLWTPTALSAAVINKLQLGMDICCLSHRTPQSCTLPCCS